MTNHKNDLDAELRELNGLVESQSEKIEKLRAAVLFLQQYAKDTADYWDAKQDMKVGKRLLAMAGTLKNYDRELTEALATAKE